MIEVYTDGSIRKGVISYAVAIVEKGDGLVDDRLIHTLSGIVTSYPEHRNITGELWAVLMALQWCQQAGYNNIHLWFDYLGVEKWVTGEWQANKALTQYYKAAVALYSMTITFHHVRGHTGNVWNEFVDKLALSATKGE